MPRRGIDGPGAARNLLRAVALVVVLVGLAGLAAPLPARCAVTCRPIITLKTVQTTALHDMKRDWTAILDVNVFFCATSFGRFEMDFIREKENAPDMQFTERFEWRPGETTISIELAQDESIAAYRIGFIAPCVCREVQF
jgi:hypothetical protein